MPLQTVTPPSAAVATRPPTKKMGDRPEPPFDPASGGGAGSGAGAGGGVSFGLGDEASAALGGGGAAAAAAPPGSRRTSVFPPAVASTDVCDVSPPRKLAV